MFFFSGASTNLQCDELSLFLCKCFCCIHQFSYPFLTSNDKGESISSGESFLLARGNFVSDLFSALLRMKSSI